MDRKTANIGGAEDPGIMAKAFAGIIGGDDFVSVVHGGRIDIEPRFENPDGTVSAYVGFLTPASDGGLHAVKFEFRPSECPSEFADDGDGPGTSWLGIESWVSRHRDGPQGVRMPRCFEQCEALRHRMDDSIRSGLRDPETAETVLSPDFIWERLLSVRGKAAELGVGILPSMSLDKAA